MLLSKGTPLVRPGIPLRRNLSKNSKENINAIMWSESPIQRKNDKDPSRLVKR